MLRLRFSFFATTLTLSVATASASEYRNIEKDADRLACYDAQPVETEGACEVENLKFIPNGIVGVRMKGTTTCENGQLTYLIFDKNGDFLDAGFHFFEGFVFDAYTDLPPPPILEGMTLNYNVLPWR